jgi:acyl-coenzyme A thioesterase PaaI-like protein
MKQHGDRLKATFTPQKDHEGWPGIVHGGVIASLLYELMENLAYHQGAVTMMRSMKTRYRAPASVGHELSAESWQESRDGRQIAVRGELRSTDGKVVADGAATLVVLSQEQLARHGLG